MILSGTRPANHDGVEHAGDSAGQPLNRLFERHTLQAGLAFLPMSAVNFAVALYVNRLIRALPRRPC
jgi:hypothetical protein